jgi:hypothetical protein
VSVGVELVRRDLLNHISVMASPMGYELYNWLGFEKVGTLTIQGRGERKGWSYRLCCTGRQSCGGHHPMMQIANG